MFLLGPRLRVFLSRLVNSTYYLCCIAVLCFRWAICCVNEACLTSLITRSTNFQLLSLACVASSPVCGLWCIVPIRTLLRNLPSASFNHYFELSFQQFFIYWRQQIYGNSPNRSNAFQRGIVFNFIPLTVEVTPWHLLMALPYTYLLSHLTLFCILLLIISVCRGVNVFPYAIFSVCHFPGTTNI